MSSAQVIKLPQAEPGRPRPTAADLARPLIENLAGLQGLLRQLLESTTAKLAAIRAADAEGLQRGAAREAEMLEQVYRLEQQRTAVLARLAQVLPGAAAKQARLSEIAALLPEPAASALRARNAALQQIALELRQKNGLVARVARHLQSHLAAVFSALAQANQESVVYGPKGQHAARRVRSWVDAVG